jgi:hypothetical protein
MIRPRLPAISPSFSVIPSPRYRLKKDVDMAASYTINRAGQSRPARDAPLEMQSFQKLIL